HQSLPVIIQKNDNSARQWHRLFSVGRHKTWHETGKITQKYEHCNASNNCEVPRGAVPNDVIEQVFNAHAHRIRQEKFHALLRRAGTFHRHSRTQPQKENNREEENHQFHRKEVRDRILQIRRLQMQHRKKRQSRLGQQPVNQFCYAQNLLFAHESPATCSTAWVLMLRNQDAFHRCWPCFTSYASSSRMAGTTATRPHRNAIAGNRNQARITYATMSSNTSRPRNFACVLRGTCTVSAPACAIPKRINPSAPCRSHRKLSQHSAVPIATASAARIPQPIPAPAAIAMPRPKIKPSIRRSMAFDSASVAIFLVRRARHFQDLA